MNSSDQDIFARKRRDTFNETATTESSFSTELFSKMSSTTTQPSTTIGPDQKSHRKVYFGYEAIFAELYHFTEYSIEVQACQDENINANACGITAITSVRTLPLRMSFGGFFTIHFINIAFLQPLPMTSIKSPLHIRLATVQMKPN